MEHPGQSLIGDVVQSGVFPKGMNRGKSIVVGCQIRLDGNAAGSIKSLPRSQREGRFSGLKFCALAQTGVIVFVFHLKPPFRTSRVVDLDGDDDGEGGYKGGLLGAAGAGERDGRTGFSSGAARQRTKKETVRKNGRRMNASGRKMEIRMARASHGVPVQTIIRVFEGPRFAFMVPRLFYVQCRGAVNTSPLRQWPRGVPQKADKPGAKKGPRQSSLGHDGVRLLDTLGLEDAVRLVDRQPCHLTRRVLDEFHRDG